MPPKRIAASSVTFFETAAQFRAWLTQHHASASVLQVGFYKKDSGRKSITYPEALDQALCFGWIDGVRHTVDDESYTVRFTPRQPQSKWSAVNLRRFRQLEAQGLVQPSGRKAFEDRDTQATPGSIAARPRGLTPPYERRFKAKARAWAFFRGQPPWYQRACAAFVLDAKHEETRLRRLAIVIEHSAKGKWIPPLERARGARGTSRGSR